MAPIPKLMKAVQIEKTGGTEVLQYKDVPVPMPKNDEVLIKNEFIGVNYIDTYFRTGLYPNPKPMILGREGSGTIASVGSEVAKSLGFAEGDRVAFMGTSAYADFTACPADKVLKVPDRVSPSDACSALLQGLTALTLVEETHKVQSGDWVLVLAATGGVGGWLCQILRAKGAKTIGTVGSEEKVATAKEQGADVVVIDRPGQGDVLKTVKECTEGRGVAAVFDGVGKDTFERSLECVARKGTVASFGNASGAVEPFLISKLSAKNAKIARPTLYNYVATRQEFEHYSDELFKIMMEDKFSVRIHETYPLKDVARAHTDIESRKTMGKLLLKP
ncbi:MAG: hypothetical protein LQ352_003019 [Teloschistes flavicans]|nr:MAG: hypothetical protein LQ352_003019 [Teloschistes flavicans]